MTLPRLYAHILERDSGELDWLANTKAATLCLFGEVKFPPIVTEQLADSHVAGDGIGRCQNAADPMRLIRNWTVSFSGDECVDNTERGSRNSHDVHEATDHIEVAVMVIPPFLIDGADPVLQCSGDWFDVMVLGFRRVDDHVSIEQWDGQGQFLNDASAGNFNCAIRRFIATQIDQFSTFSFRLSGHARDLHALHRREEAARRFCDLNSRRTRFFCKSYQRADD